MRFRYILLLFLFSWTIGHTILAQSVTQYPHERVIKMGDDLSWADPNYDHSEWSQLGYINELGNYWVRFRINYDSSAIQIKHPGLQIISTGSYEMFWDGIKIKESGKVGNDQASEIPGPMISQLLIPDSLLADGSHVVAFRVSNHHWLDIGYPTWNQFYIEEYLSSRIDGLALSSWVFILAGLYLMVSIYYLFTFFFRQKEIYAIIISSICFLFFSLILVEYSKFFYQYAYSFHPTRLGIILILNLLISFLMPLFFLQYFHIPYKKILSFFLLLIFLAIISFNLFNMDSINELLGDVMWVTVLLIVVYAVIKKKKESRIILAAVIIAGLIVHLFPVALTSMIHEYDVTFFLGFSILVLALIYLRAKRTQEQRLSYEASQFLSARLQNELLKKNIQPHFIMNTLTSLMEWVEESPTESVKFIEALAGEFEIMSEIAEKKLIPIEQEIELCRKHISIMKFRKEIMYEFTHDHIPDNRLVPPAVFHTIVENAISHSIANDNNTISIHLSFPNILGYYSYELKTTAKNRSNDSTQEGTGLKYIRSRLTENYRDQWELTSHAVQDGWVTRIDIKTNAI